MNLNECYNTLSEMAEQGRDLFTCLLVIGVLAGIYAATRIGLYLLARRRGVSGARAAWFPIGDQIVLWKLSDQYRRSLTGQRIYPKAPVIVTEVFFIATGLVSMGWIGVFSIILAFAGLRAFGVLMANLGLLMFGGLEGADHLLDAGDTVQYSELRVFFLVGAVLLLVLTGITLLRTWLNSRSLLNVYRSCRKKAAGVWLVLGILFPPLKPVFLFLCAKNKVEEDEV